MNREKVMKEQEYFLLTPKAAFIVAFIFCFFDIVKAGGQDKLHPLKEDISLISDRNTGVTSLLKRKVKAGPLPENTQRDYCIWIVSPRNYIHSHVFDEIGLGLNGAFSELGINAP